MKAIYIPNNFSKYGDLDDLNLKLKDAYKIETEIKVSHGEGTILIVSSQTRKDKLKEIDKISKQ